MKKKLLIVSVISLLILVGCTQDALENYNGQEPATGTLILNPVIGGIKVITEQIGTTRAAPDLSEFKVRLKDPNIIFGPSIIVDFPADGILREVPAGPYVCTVYYNGAISPAFEFPSYSGNNLVTITAGETAQVQVDVYFINSGIRFTFDPSLEDAGYGDVVPVVEVTRPLGSYIRIEGGVKDATLYLDPSSEALLTIEHRGVPMVIDGAIFRELTFRKGWVHNYVIKASPSLPRSLELTVEEETMGQESAPE